MARFAQERGGAKGTCKMEPVRTCVGCRTRGFRSTLLRVVSQNDTLIVDERAVLPGRGAWVHPAPECMAAALQRHAFGRALRASTQLDTRNFEQHPSRNKG